MSIIKVYWKEKPLLLILLAAIFFRLIAVIFSKGYGMHDDHFLIIEAAQSWVDGLDYNNWLPKNNVDGIPEGHSFFYVGIHYILFSIMNFFKIIDPQTKMFIIRILHAAFSLIVVSLGFKITRKLSNQDNAKIVGLLLAILYMMPWLSVRNLVEIVCIPFLMIGVWMIMNYKEKKVPLFQILFAGLIMGLAFSTRFQTILFAFGIGLVFLFEKKWKEAFIFGFGYCLSIGIIQGIPDFLIWGYPFAELTEYVKYNIDNATNYNTQAWHMYIGLLIGILIPPISLFIIFGFLRYWKKYLFLVLPTMLFIIFHSYFPNKQERFILSILPFLLIIGIIGWNEFVGKSMFWQKNMKLLKACWIFFWIINLSVLPFISTMYSKKAYCETMSYLEQYDDSKMILVERTNHWRVNMLPRFYMNQWVGIYEVNKSNNVDKLQAHINNTQKQFYPRFFIFFEEKNLENRVEDMKKVFPNIEYETTIEPGLVDKVLYWMNPVNANETMFIYRNKDFFPEKKK